MAKTKAFKGDGSCTFRGNDKNGMPIYEVTVYGGFNPVTRKYDKRTRRVHGSKQDAMRVRDELKAEISGGIINGADKVKFHDFSRTWYEKRKADGEVSKSTLKNNDYALKVIDEYIGACRLKDVTPLVVDNLYAAIRNDRGYSGSTMKQIHTALNHVMRRAVDLGYIVANPCDKVAKPKAGASDRKSLDFEQLARLRRIVSEAWNAELEDFRSKEERRADRGDSAERAYIRDVRPLSCLAATLIALASGARRGEVLALTWQDIDLERGTLRINKTITEDMEIKEPKTKAGIRAIALDAGTIEALRDWKTLQREIMALLGRIQSGSTPVCINSLGSNLEPHNFSHWWKTFRTKAGFGGLKFHELRHTQATVLLSKGTDVKTVSARLGHSSASITLDMYAHSMPEIDREAASTIAEVFARPIEGENIVKIA